MPHTNNHLRQTQIQIACKPQATAVELPKQRIKPFRYLPQEKRGHTSCMGVAVQHSRCKTTQLQFKYNANPTSHINSVDETRTETLRQCCNTKNPVDASFFSASSPCSPEVHCKLKPAYSPVYTTKENLLSARVCSSDSVHHVPSQAERRCRVPVVQQMCGCDGPLFMCEGVKVRFWCNGLTSASLGFHNQCGRATHE